MPVTLNLSPEVEAGLSAQAQAAGMSLDEFVSRQLLEVLTTRNAVPPLDILRASSPVGPDQWESELEAWLDSFPQTPVLSDDALDRESWYPDRW